jgi:glycine/D-amino acid oxidase-like deaminating enzyme/nitrite reductase/ring-hydroxylating ferredoxin subunit
MARDSYWFRGVERPSFPRLWGDRTADVAIVGGGITGLTAAALLREQGLSVVVVEARRIGDGVTGGTTAHLTAVTDCRFNELLSTFGEDGARRVWATGMAAIDRIETWVKEKSIACDFARIPGALYAAKEGHVSWLERQMQAARKIGVPFDDVDTLPLPFPVPRAMRFDGQARFHPLKYLYGLAGLVDGHNNRVFEESRVLHIQPGDPCHITTEDGRVTARHVFVATHSPIGLVTSVHTRMEAMRSYAIAVRLDGPAPEGLYWDSEDPYNYIRPQDGLWLIGGRDHKTGHGSDLASRWDQLEAWARDRAKVVEVVDRWSDQVYESTDGLPFIGPMPAARNVYMATGYAGNGMTFGTAAGMMFADHVLGRKNPWSDLYDVGRVHPIAEAPRFLKENIESAVEFVMGRLSPGDARSLEAVPQGEGRLVRVDGKKVAAYRDEDGELHLMSPVCTHAGCHVAWNDAEKTWDCPCHGGRYSAMGEVLDGPPVRGLDSAEPAARVYSPSRREKERPS